MKRQRRAGIGKKAVALAYEGHSARAIAEMLDMDRADVLDCLRKANAPLNTPAFANGNTAQALQEAYVRGFSLEEISEAYRYARVNVVRLLSGKETLSAPKERRGFARRGKRRTTDR